MDETTTGIATTTEQTTQLLKTTTVETTTTVEQTTMPGALIRHNVPRISTITDQSINQSKFI